MQYEMVILELMTRIKKLEDEVEQLKHQLGTTQELISSDSSSETNENTATYRKMTAAMIDLCYYGGKRVLAGENLVVAADQIVSETDMNRNSAIMYLYAVDAMLKGSEYKRAISTKAMRRYFDLILNDYGKAGLKRAIRSTRLHINYRLECGHKVDSITAICDDYETRYNL